MQMLTDLNPFTAFTVTPNKSKELVFQFAHLQIFRSANYVCGGYRSRTDDPLRARQML